MAVSTSRSRAVGRILCANPAALVSTKVAASGDRARGRPVGRARPAGRPRRRAPRCGGGGGAARGPRRRRPCRSRSRGRGRGRARGWRTLRPGVRRGRRRGWAGRRTSRRRRHRSSRSSAWRPSRPRASAAGLLRGRRRPGIRARHRAPRRRCRGRVRCWSWVHSSTRHRQSKAGKALVPQGAVVVSRPRAHSPERRSRRATARPVRVTRGHHPAAESGARGSGTEPACRATPRRRSPVGSTRPRSRPDPRRTPRQPSGSSGSALRRAAP